MKLEKYKNFKEFEVYKFTPDLIHAFPFYMENITWTWRVRCVLEFFVGYEIFYIKIGEKWAGYCVVSNGKNGRYKFSDAGDIIYGRYYIAEGFRGRQLAAKMLECVLNYCDINYKNAYAYVHYDNIASNKTMNAIGASEINRFFIKGILRNKLIFNPEGDFILYQYNPRRQQ